MRVLSDHTALAGPALVVCIRDLFGSRVRNQEGQISRALLEIQLHRVVIRTSELRSPDHDILELRERPQRLGNASGVGWIQFWYSGVNRGLRPVGHVPRRAGRQEG